MDKEIVHFWHSCLDEKTGEMCEILTAISFEKYLTEILNKELLIVKKGN